MRMRVIRLDGTALLVQSLGVAARLSDRRHPELGLAIQISI